jgi:hypothetical protein
MRKLLSILFAAIFFASCTKDPNTGSTTPTIADGTFQYKVNGNLVTISNANITNGEYAVFFKQLQGTAIPRTRYMFNGQKGTNHVWAFGIQSDSLTVRNYTYDSTYLNTSGIICTMTYNAQQSALFYGGDNMIINVTSYSNSYISGNFTAKFTPFGSVGTVPDYSTRGTTLITEGQFKNIKCIY